MDIVSVPLVVNSAMDTMVVKARLPNGTNVDQFVVGAERKPALNVLHGLFQGDRRRRSDEEMDVVRHDHEFVEQKAALLALWSKKRPCLRFCCMTSIRSPAIL